MRVRRRVGRRACACGRKRAARGLLGARRVRRRRVRVRSGMDGRRLLPMRSGMQRPRRCVAASRRGTSPPSVRAQRDGRAPTARRMRSDATARVGASASPTAAAFAAAEGAVPNRRCDCDAGWTGDRCEAGRVRRLQRPRRVRAAGQRAQLRLCLLPRWTGAACEEDTCPALLRARLVPRRVVRLSRRLARRGVRPRHVSWTRPHHLYNGVAVAARAAAGVAAGAGVEGLAVEHGDAATGTASACAGSARAIRRGVAILRGRHVPAALLGPTTAPATRASATANPGGREPTAPKPRAQGAMAQEARRTREVHGPRPVRRRCFSARARRMGRHRLRRPALRGGCSGTATASAGACVCDATHWGAACRARRLLRTLASCSFHGSCVGGAALRAGYAGARCELFALPPPSPPPPSPPPAPPPPPPECPGGCGGNRATATSEVDAYAAAGGRAQTATHGAGAAARRVAVAAARVSRPISSRITHSVSPASRGHPPRLSSQLGFHTVVPDVTRRRSRSSRTPSRGSLTRGAARKRRARARACSAVCVSS